jgi:hypothetical protein
MSQVISVFGLFGVLAAAYGCDRLILFLRMQMARTFDTALYYPLILLAGLLMAGIMLAYTLYVVLSCKKDTAVGIVALIFGVSVLAFAALSLFLRASFVIQPGSYLSFVAGFIALLGLALLVLPSKWFEGGRRYAS